MQQSLPDFAEITDKQLRRQILNFFENQARQIAHLTKALDLANQELNYHALTDVDSGKVQAALVLCLLSPDS